MRRSCSKEKHIPCILDLTPDLSLASNFASRPRHCLVAGPGLNLLSLRTFGHGDTSRGVIYVIRRVLEVATGSVCRQCVFERWW